MREPSRPPLAASPQGLGLSGGTVVSIEVNGTRRQLHAESRTRLLDVLRGACELSSVRDGCSVGMCGACTVLVDGSAVSSCLTLAVLCDGCRIQTAESLEADGRLDPVAQAFLDARAFQCGYCTPGFVIALRGLLDVEPSPSRSQLEVWLSGHICRCGSYSRILDAAEHALRALASEESAGLQGDASQRTSDAPQRKNGASDGRPAGRERRVSASPEFHAPEDLDEAIALLATADGDGLVVAGATAVTLLLHHRLVWPSALVSLRRVPGLDRVELAGGVLRVGALVTHARMATDPLVVSHLPVLAETFAVVANHRVRAAATVGGVLAEADHASDPPATLRALDACAVVAGPGGERRVDVGDLVTGHYETSLRTGEVVVAVEVPLLPAGTSGAYLKFRSTASEDRPCVGVAAFVRLAPGGICEDLRVCVGAACETPLRLPETEAAARGRRFDLTLVEEMAEAYASALRPVADVRGSAWYRREVTRVVVERALWKSEPKEQGAAV